MIPDIDRVTRLIVEAAADEVLPRFRRLAAGDIRTKSGPRDLVTAADEACEAQLTGCLGDLLPGSLVVGEEAAAADPDVLGHLSEDAPVWLIDPVDGTLNFTEGKEHFAVIVALVRDRETVAGWIHEPLTGATVAASHGDGAWEGARRLAVARAAPLAEMTAALYVGPKRTPALHQRLGELKERLGPRAFTRSAGAEYLALARGDLHYAIFTRLLPWDHAAGNLLHAEAGGHAACLDGRRYRPEPIDGPLLLAPDAECWRQLVALFAGGEADFIPPG